MTSPKIIVIKALAALMLAGVCGLGFAGQVAGTVVNLSGALLAKKADGAVKVLVVKSEVEQGDTLVSEKNTYAQIRFVDNSEITLKPNTTFKVEAFAYDAGKPAGDSASFSLVKGGLRSITGLLGKRNKEKFQLKTPSATIGIRGTTFSAEFVAEGVSSALAPGLHVNVTDGMINVSNDGGSQLFSAGQFGFVPSVNMPPVIVPADAGVQFTVPAAFLEVKADGAGVGVGASEKISCEVR
ncbi:FecR family protein [Massilia sp. TWP1-3-3]|uniref:FecR family protein n=1 Tax=Massilia sp. TWP1-3-3 TaxID=2804573 RepID=UPI003CE767FB